jgi:predicted 3-demethylubiquinone-9 3-methyltransferase (glyoxalase superfamily)
VPGDINQEVLMGALESYPRVTPFLWFDSNAEDAVEFYLSVFKNSQRLDDFQPKSDGNSRSKPLTIAFELDGQKFTALNGGPMFKFNEAISFVVRCDSQAEIDEYWEKLSAGGREVQCGWLKDKFGVSWQIVPARMGELVRHPKAMEAMMKMTKLNIADLEQAAKS